MVKKIMANGLLGLIVALLVFAISYLAGYITSLLINIGIDIEIAPYKPACLFLILFLYMGMVEIYCVIIERLKKASE